MEIGHIAYFCVRQTALVASSFYLYNLSIDKTFVLQ
jgi:hypothetical protein